jgi:hypothetical protein
MSADSVRGQLHHCKTSILSNSKRSSAHQLVGMKIAACSDHSARRKTGWLMPSELRRIGTKIEKLGSEMARPVNGAQLYGITIVFTPLKHRRRPIKATRRAAKANLK